MDAVPQLLEWVLCDNKCLKKFSSYAGQSLGGPNITFRSLLRFNIREKARESVQTAWMFGFQATSHKHLDWSLEPFAHDIATVVVRDPW